MNPVKASVCTLLLTTTSLLSATDPPAIALQPFAEGYNAPTFMIPYQSGERAFLVGEQPGLISLLGEKGGKRGGTFLDIRSRMDFLRKGFDERGLLGLALHPDFEKNRKFYLYYSGKLADDAPENFDHTIRVSEFLASEDGTRGELESEKVLLSIHQPQWNHNSGNIVFGKDGFLYIGVGDGGAANDLAPGHAECGNGQALDTLLGKILRIDVNGSEGAVVPPDNPLVGKDGLPEIYAWGIRNPWGLFVDHGADGRIIFADVGQNRFEEANVLKRGANYGWPRFEGFATFDQKNPSEAITLEDSLDVSSGDTERPVLVYPHPGGSYGDSPALGISVTGGPVYRGSAIKGLQGWYVFADWAMSWAGPKHGLFAAQTTDSEWLPKKLPGGTAPDGKDAWVTAFAEDSNKEVYVLTNNKSGLGGTTGKIWKIVPAK